MTGKWSSTALIAGAIVALLCASSAPRQANGKPPTPQPPPTPVIYDAILLPTDLGTRVVACHVNKQGLTVGYAWNVGGVNTAFLYDPIARVMLDLNLVAPAPAGCWLWGAFGINDAGAIAGKSTSGPFLYDPNTQPPRFDLLPQGGGLALETPVNQLGDVAYRSGDSALIYTWDRQLIQVTIPQLEYLYGISDSRHLVGRVRGGTNGAKWTGFVYTQGQPILYFTSSDLRLLPVGINGFGEFCGYNASKASTGDKAFRFTDDGLETLTQDSSTARVINTPRVGDANLHGDVAGLLRRSGADYWFLYTDEHGLLDLDNSVRFENADAAAKWKSPSRADNSVSISDRTANGFPIICVSCLGAENAFSSFVLTPRLP